MEIRGGKSARVHFGHGELSTDPATSVFINCPFDDDFQSTFDASGTERFLGRIWC